MSTIPPSPTSLYGSAAPGGAALSTPGSNVEQLNTPLRPVGTNADGVRPNWWSPPTAPWGSGGDGAAPGTGGFFGVITSLINQLGAAIAQLNGTSQTSPGTLQQNAADATFTSTGDPHLSETGTVTTATGNATVDTHFTSMAAHADLLDSSALAGGYRLSTAVTDPNANGVTYNRSATVSLNHDRDSVTLNNDGSYSILSDGTALSVNSGASLTLAGGASVAREANGSLVIDVPTASGGSIDTTLTPQTTGVDVSAHVVNTIVGGDIVANDPSQASTPPPLPTTPPSNITPPPSSSAWLSPQLDPTPTLPVYAPTTFTS